MKTMIPHSQYPQKILTWTAFTVVALLAASAMAQPTSPPALQIHKFTVATGGSGGEGASAGPGASAGTGVIRIQSIEPGRGKEPAREVTWLGLSTEDVSEALTAQLGLKPGQGLVVTFVAPESPAAKAGIQKYDVIEELGDQTLVDPGQLRKLIQMQKDGDTIKLTLHRGGKKQTVSATLVKRTEGLGMLSTGQAMELSALAGSKDDNWVFENRKTPTAYSAVNRQMVDTEVQRNMEQARTAIQDALRQSSQATTRMGRPMPPMPPKAPAFPTMVDVGNNATVTVTQDGVSVKTIVKSDDTGIFILIASPKKHLTAHDQDGKLLFDGDIETPEQQQKLPAELLKKIKPLIEQLKPEADEQPEPHAQSATAPKI